MLTEHQIKLAIVEQERGWKAAAQANRAELDFWYEVARQAAILGVTEEIGL